MYPVEPDVPAPANTPTPNTPTPNTPTPSTPTPSTRRRARRQALTALGLLALPIAGTAVLPPAMAGASTATTRSVAWADSTAATMPTPDDVAAADAFFAAGYSYDDAIALAQRWATPDDPYQAKVAAGEYLARGVALAESHLADPTFDDHHTDAQLVELFFASGYTVQDAALLADQWNVGIGEAKARAGSELKTVGVLPHVDPPPAPGDPVGAANAFFEAGYDHDDAVLLADFWGLEVYETKVKAGTWLLTGESLPMMAGISPSP